MPRNASKKCEKQIYHIMLRGITERKYSLMKKTKRDCGNLSGYW